MYKMVNTLNKMSWLGILHRNHSTDIYIYSVMVIIVYFAYIQFCQLNTTKFKTEGTIVVFLIKVNLQGKSISFRWYKILSRWETWYRKGVESLLSPPKLKQITIVSLTPPFRLLDVSTCMSLLSQLTFLTQRHTPCQLCSVATGSLSWWPRCFLTQTCLLYGSFSAMLLPWDYASQMACNRVLYLTTVL